MHRIDAAGYAAGNLFTDGNPATATPATVVDAAFLNAVQESIALTIEGTGEALVKGDHTQLRRAITKMVQSGQRSVIVNNAVFAPAVAGTGKAVYWDAANSRFDLALADGSSKQAAVGFADVPNAAVVAFGDATLFSGLTPGARYYLDGTTAGAITTTSPTNAVFVGVARSAAEMFVDIDVVTSAPVVTTVTDPTYADNSTKPASTGWMRAAMSAIATAAGFVFNSGANGHLKLPSWLGGWMAAWGTLPSTNVGNTGSATFSLAFPTACRGVVAQTTGVSLDWWSNAAVTTTGCSFTLNGSANGASGWYFAWGY